MSPHKQAVAAIAAISAAMLLASACVLMAGTGHRTGLLEHVVERAPYMSARALAHSPVWRQDVTKAVADKERQLQKAKKQVGEQLKQDMTQLFDAKDTDLKQEHTKLHELKQVEVMKGRYEAILHAIETAPVLTPEAPVAPKGAKQAQAQQEKGMKVVDERNGRVYVLYPYNPAPGGYADKELSPDPLMADDEKTFGNFNDPISRNPIYQGHAPDYADGVPLPQYVAERARAPQMLYAPNDAPGGYANADLTPDELLGDDQKTFGNFNDAITRNPIYQGVGPDYTDGVPLSQFVEERAAPQMLRQAMPEREEAPRMMVMRDRAGQLRAVDPRMIRGLQVERMHERAMAVERHNAMVRQLLAARRQRAMAAAAVAPTKARKSASPKVAVSKKASSAKKGQMQMLTDMPSSQGRVWGKVYNPVLVALPGQAKADASVLTGLAKKEFEKWDKLSTKLNKVYDPAADRVPAHNMPRHNGIEVGKNGNWWAKHAFVGTNDKTDKWWSHDHTNRGY